MENASKHHKTFLKYFSKVDNDVIHQPTKFELKNQLLQRETKKINLIRG
uniref:Uncharacterized protein n=1 Tax=Arundo donax TaxID=35708 RepID=A0A0A9H5W3_ARUDO